MGDSGDASELQLWLSQLYFKKPIAFEEVVWGRRVKATKADNDIREGESEYITKIMRPANNKTVGKDWKPNYLPDVVISDEEKNWTEINLKEIAPTAEVKVWGGKSKKKDKKVEVQTKKSGEPEKKESKQERDAEEKAEKDAKDKSEREEMAMKQYLLLVPLKFKRPKRNMKTGVLEPCSHDFIPSYGVKICTVCGTDHKSRITVCSVKFEATEDNLICPECQEYIEMDKYVFGSELLPLLDLFSIELHQDWGVWRYGSITGLVVSIFYVLLLFIAFIVICNDFVSSRGSIQDILIENKYVSESTTPFQCSQYDFIDSNCNIPEVQFRYKWTANDMWVPEQYFPLFLTISRPVLFKSRSGFTQRDCDVINNLPLTDADYPEAFKKSSFMVENFVLRKIRNCKLVQQVYMECYVVINKARLAKGMDPKVVEIEKKRIEATYNFFKFNNAIPDKIAPSFEGWINSCANDLDLQVSPPAGDPLPDEKLRVPYTAPACFVLDRKYVVDRYDTAVSDALTDMWKRTSLLPLEKIKTLARLKHADYDQNRFIPNMYSSLVIQAEGYHYLRLDRPPSQALQQYTNIYTGADIGELVLMTSIRTPLDSYPSNEKAPATLPVFERIPVDLGSTSLTEEMLRAKIAAVKGTTNDFDATKVQTVNDFVTSLAKYPKASGMTTLKYTRVSEYSQNSLFSSLFTLGLDDKGRNKSVYSYKGKASFKLEGRARRGPFVEINMKLNEGTIKEIGSSDPATLARPWISTQASVSQMFKIEVEPYTEEQYDVKRRTFMQCICLFGSIGALLYVTVGLSMKYLNRLFFHYTSGVRGTAWLDNYPITQPDDYYLARHLIALRNKLNAEYKSKYDWAKLVNTNLDEILKTPGFAESLEEAPPPSPPK